eukprot:1870846-Rhodomonas_salina.3
MPVYQNKGSVSTTTTQCSTTLLVRVSPSGDGDRAAGEFNFKEVEWQQAACLFPEYEYEPEY